MPNLSRGLSIVESLSLACMLNLHLQRVLFLITVLGQSRNSTFYLLEVWDRLLLSIDCFSYVSIRTFLEIVL